MRLARFAHSDREGWGFVDGDHVRPVDGDGSLLEALSDPARLADAMGSTVAKLDLDDVRLLAPIPDPPQFIGVGLNYRDHATEAGLDVPDAPVTFGFLRSAIIGPGEPIRLPSFTRSVDWEAELAIVIGRGGRDLSPDDAVDAVAGYVIVNDVSARDVQAAESQWGRAKSFDTFKPMGPWIACTDELGAASDLAISLSLNGTTMQESTTGELIFDVPDIVSRLSVATTLLPGTVISTGTPSGVGFSRTPPVFLSAGDEVSIAVDGIGVLTNPVVAAG